jgi:nucleotide-binding universal stress UspA family protein
LKFDETFIVGSPASCIARQAREGKYDVVLMGSHGRTAPKNLLFGSVTSRALTGCDVPVLAW